MNLDEVAMSKEEIYKKRNLPESSHANNSSPTEKEHDNELAGPSYE